MSVELDPPELGFKRPFTHEVSQVLRLHNPTSDPIAFKVKTTAPKQYCVRPNSGRIEGGRDVEVQVLLQAMKQDPPPETKCRDKFLVQSVAIPATAEKDASVTQIWTGIEETNKSSIQETKIRVNFLPADAGAPAPGAAAATTNGVSAPNDSPPSYTAPSPSVSTPQRASGPVSEAKDRPLDNKHLGEALNSTTNPSASPASTHYASPAQSSTTNSTGVAGAAASMGLPTSQQELKNQLDEAKATIARLQSQVQESAGLRQRKGDNINSPLASEKSGTTAQTQVVSQGGGVPMHYAALMCVVAFLLAYFLF
ncbi:hypothetical protein MBLNU230_g1465t1 [Neophaeotheca triangularis]